jgi:Planctomycete cytochrome C
MKFDKISLSLAMLVTLTVVSWVTSCTHEADISNLPEICFTGEVLPIFVNNCAISGCHNGGGRESRMALNSYSNIIKGIVPGNPNSSSLYQAVIAKWGNGMPPRQPLSEQNRTIIRVWIEQGAGETVCTDTTGSNGSGNPGGTPQGNDYVARSCFTRDILPVLISNCATTGCHDAATHKEGYNLTSYTSAMSAVSPGNPSSSRLYQAITTTSGENKMPPSTKPQLTTAEIDSIFNWISYGALNETCGEVCDTINPVTFSGTIWPVIQTSCTGCHSGASPGGNILLASYANVQAAAVNGSLINSITGNGVTKMPKGGSLSTCRIRQFEIWVNSGSLNN